MGKPKHIAGYTVNSDQGMFVVFSCSREYGYDQISRVEDLSRTLETKTTFPRKYSDATTILNYVGFPQTEKIKSFRIHFESGDTDDIEVLVPSVNSKFEDFVGFDVEKKVYGPGDLFNYSVIGIDRFNLSDPTVTYAVLPQSDPGDVFSYDRVWKTKSSGEVVSFVGSEIFKEWSVNGYSGGLPKNGIKGVQHASFAAVIGNELDSPGDVWNTALDPNTTALTVIGFVWAKDLPSISDGQLERYEVCNDPTSPSYYRTTGADIYGTVIPAESLNGTNEAIFGDCPCAIDCTKFRSVLDVTPSSSIGLGEIRATVSANSANPGIERGTNISAYDAAKLPVYPDLNLSQFQYDLIVPQGVVYKGVITSGVVNNTNWTFSNIPSGSGVWKVQITDIATGCITTINANVWDETAPTKGTCTDPGSLNFDALATIACDDCCLSCKPGYLTRRSVPLGQNLILNSGSSIVNTTTESSNDGIINFFGSVNTSVDPIIESYLSGTYTINLYNTTGAGESMGTAVSLNPLQPNPSFVFSGLAPGWYGIQVFSTGELCVSTYYFKVETSDNSRNNCQPSVSWSVDPVSGFTMAVVTSGGAISTINYTVDGVFIGPIPPNVSVGQTVCVNVAFVAEAACVEFNECRLVTVADIPDKSEEEPVVSGCTDPLAVNYNPSAKSNDGSCFYGVPGCMDPMASNFNPSATISNGTCSYGISGCMEAGSTNYDPNATIDDGSCVDACTEEIFSQISLVGQVANIIFTNTPIVYSVSWVNAETGEEVVIENSTSSGILADGIYIVTVTTGIGCQQTYILGVNETPMFGCTDTNASNYSPAANISDFYSENNGTTGTSVSGPCEYMLEPSPCVPADLDKTLLGLDECVAEKLTDFANLLKTGRLKDCNTKDIRVTALLRYLLSRRGLPCLYNCADSLSPTYSETDQGTTCGSKWQAGGPSGESLVFDIATTYFWGDVVKHPVSGDIYTMTNEQPIFGLDPESELGQGLWKYCKEPVGFSDVTNRLDAYLAYLADQCRDCNLPSVAPASDNGGGIKPTIPDTIDGQSININGTVEL